MTEQRGRPPRADLQALAPTPAQTERVIGAIMARLATRPQGVGSGGDLLELVGGFLSPAWIAAAVLVIAGSAAVMASGRFGAETTSADTTVAAWAAQEHVPTNAELLLTFQGYQR